MNLLTFSLLSIFLFGDDAVQLATNSKPSITDSLPVPTPSVVLVTQVIDITTVVYPTRTGTAQTIPKSVPVPTGPPYARCSLGRCLLDNGAVVNGESMEGHLAPDTNLLTSEVEFRAAHYNSTIGDIILNFSDDVPKLPLAILQSCVNQDGDKFIKWMFDSHNGSLLGYIVVKRPTPDPDTRFESIAQDHLLAAIPSGLRSVADPNFLVPSPTKGCATRKCVSIIPVSTRNMAILMFLTNIMSDSRSVLFWPATDQCSLSFERNRPTAHPYPTAEYVRSTLSLAVLTLCTITDRSFRDPSYVYIVYKGADMFNYCREWMNGPDGDEPPETISLKSDQVRTLEYRTEGPPATKAMNFGDLPCPPSAVADMYKHGDPYFPIIAPWYGIASEQYFLGQKISHDDCVVAAIRDPPVRAIRVDHITGPEDGSGGGIP